MTGKNGKSKIWYSSKCGCPGSCMSRAVRRCTGGQRLLSTTSLSWGSTHAMDLENHSALSWNPPDSPRNKGAGPDPPSWPSFLLLELCRVSVQAGGLLRASLCRSLRASGPPPATLHLPTDLHGCCWLPPPLASLPRDSHQRCSTDLPCTPHRRAMWCWALKARPLPPAPPSQPGLLLRLTCHPLLSKAFHLPFPPLILHSPLPRSPPFKSGQGAFSPCEVTSLSFGPCSSSLCKTR